MASRKHTTEPAQLDLSFAPAEEWRTITGYEGYYEVSSLGRVRSVERRVAHKVSGTLQRHAKILSPDLSKGYYRVQLSKVGQQRRYQVHRLVLLAFCGEPPEGYLFCNHIDGNRTNNHISNLEWVNQQGNMQNALQRGVMFIGERQVSAILNDENVRQIRTMFLSGMTQTAIAQHFGVSITAIWFIVHGKHWTHVH